MSRSRITLLVIVALVAGGVVGWFLASPPAAPRLVPGRYVFEPSSAALLDTATGALFGLDAKDRRWTRVLGPVPDPWPSITIIDELIAAGSVDKFLEKSERTTRLDQLLEAIGRWGPPPSPATTPTR